MGKLRTVIVNELHAAAIVDNGTNLAALERYSILIRAIQEAGYAIVPVEPTEDMLAQMYDGELADSALRREYQAVIAAAPDPLKE